MKKYPMPVICCVCHKKIRTKKADYPGGVSHGYCKKCYRDFMEAMELIRRHKEVGNESTVYGM
jgi:hypothetical protein